MFRYEPLTINFWLPAGKDVESWTYESQGAAYEWRGGLAMVFRMFALMLSDFFSVAVALALGYILWARPILHQDYLTYGRVAYLLPVFVLAYAIAGMYSCFG